MKNFFCRFINSFEINGFDVLYFFHRKRFGVLRKEGTGDTQLTFSQEIKMDGAIIVSTPQEVALLDVKRGIKMFDKLGVKILGLVDNMSYFTGDDGKKYKIFGEGGVKRTAEEFGKEFLGEIPINSEVGKCSDEGKPIVEANPDHEISKIYLDFANKIKSTYLKS